MDTTTTPGESGGSKKITKKAFAELEKRCAALERKNQRLEDQLAAKASISDKKTYDDLLNDINNELEEAIQRVGFRVDGSFKFGRVPTDYIGLSVKRIQEQEKMVREQQEETQKQDSMLNKIKEVVQEGLESVEDAPVFDEDRLDNHIDYLVKKIWKLEEQVGEIERIPLLEQDALIQCNRADDLNFELQQERVKNVRLEQSN